MRRNGWRAGRYVLAYRMLLPVLPLQVVIVLVRAGIQSRRGGAERACLEPWSLRVSPAAPEKWGYIYIDAGLFQSREGDRCSAVCVRGSTAHKSSQTPCSVPTLRTFSCKSNGPLRNSKKFESALYLLVNFRHASQIWYSVSMSRITHNYPGSSRELIPF
ncbi:hypothetical protein VTI28DRAFT_6377 [Corynascus sepedonium]